MKVPRRQLLFGFAGLAAGVRATPVTLPAGNTQSRYRVDAALSIFGASFYSLSEAWAAAAMLEQREEDSRGTVNLRFAGGSDRQRAHGNVYAFETHRRGFIHKHLTGELFQRNCTAMTG